MVPPVEHHGTRNQNTPVRLRRYFLNNRKMVGTEMLLLQPKLKNVSNALIIYKHEIIYNYPNNLNRSLIKVLQNKYQ